MYFTYFKGLSGYKSTRLGVLGRFVWKSGHVMWAPSLHRESTDSLIFIAGCYVVATFIVVVYTTVSEQEAGYIWIQHRS